MTHYKPYSQEWHRQRYLKEALDKYFDEYVEVDVIFRRYTGNSKKLAQTLQKQI